MSRTRNPWSHVSWVVALTLLATLAVVAVQPVAAAAARSQLTLVGPVSAVDGETFRLTATLLSDGAPVAGAPTGLERRVGDGWVAAGSSTTNRRGAAAFAVTQEATTAPAVFRAVSAGDGPSASATSAAVTVALAETAAELELVAPQQAVIGHEVDLRAVARRADDGTPLAGVPVRIERRRERGWVGVATVTTDGDGRAATPATVRRAPKKNRFRAVLDGDDVVAPAVSPVVAVDPVRAETVITVGGPATVVDETTATLSIRWEALDGRAVPGVARLWTRAAGKDWRRGQRIRLGKDGAAELRVGPRVDTRFRVVGRKGAWWRSDTSEVHALDNLPPGEPVVYPAGAPRPRVKLPRQPRAVGGGANAKVRRIPAAVWNQMTGRSWHSGCPVGRSELRLVRVNYWGYDGYRYRGELVVRDDIAGRTMRAFSALYRARLPIRSMYRVDRFGWSSYLHGGNNYDSMAAGNTSGFNCRGVVGNPSVPSPHSYGRAIDINTWENPYHSRRGIVPNTWWASRSHPRIAWRSGEHPVVKVMRAHGFRWTYGVEDSQHFDG